MEIPIQSKTFTGMDIDLKDEWFSLVQQFSDDEELNGKLWQDLKNGYGQKNRAYHNLNHIKCILVELKAFELQISDLPVLKFSIWYHDLVYNAMRKDNELKSAELGKRVMTKLGFSDERIERGFEQIILTKTHQLDEGTRKDERFMIDFDLEVLSRDKEAYELYTKQIRKEYWMYPTPMYRKGRKDAMKRFLDRPYIYQTEFYRKEKEAKARENILREIETL